MPVQKIIIHRNKIIEEEPFPIRSSMDEIEDGVVYGRPLKTSIQDGKIVLSAVIGDLDDVSDGAAFGRVAKTSIMAGKIILSETDGDIDDVSDGATYGKVLKTSIFAGKIILSETDGDIDDVGDGAVYGKVLQTSLSAGKIVLTEIVGVGALASEDDLDGVPDGASYSKVLKTSISAGKIILSETQGNIDDVSDGSTYGKVLKTSLLAGKIVLSETEGDISNIADGGGYAKINSTSVDGSGIVIMSQVSGTLDDVGDGSSYKRISFSDLTSNRVDLDKILDGGSNHLVSTTEKTGAGRGYSGLNSSYEIIKGFVNSQLNSKSLPANGVRIDSNGIYCTKSSVIKFYLNNNGDAYFEGMIAASEITGTIITGGTVRTDSGTYPKVEMNSNGIYINGQSIIFRESGNVRGYIYGSLGNLQMRAYSGSLLLTSDLNDISLFAANGNVGMQSGGYSMTLNGAYAEPSHNSMRMGTTTYYWGSMAATTYYFKRQGYAEKYIQMAGNGNSIDCNHNFYVGGILSKLSGSFKIDHPLKPKTHWLEHSFVESPEMMNIYRGNAKIKNGECEIKMPNWFIPLNGQDKKDYSYHLTSIGQKNNLWVKKEINKNGRAIFKGRRDGKFSYIITAVRHDKWAREHRIQIETKK